MKFLKEGLCLAVIGAGLAAVPTLQAQALPAPAADPSLVQKIRDQADGAVTVSAEPATGKVGFVRTDRGGDLAPEAPADSAATAVDKTDAYLDQFAPALGAPADQLLQTEVESTDYGWTVSYRQEVEGVPVFGSLIRANLDVQGDLTSVNGYAAPGLTLSTAPRLTPDQAAARAVAAVEAQPPGEDGAADTTGITATRSDLAIYRLGSTRGAAGKAVLVYIVEVSNGANIRDMVFVDAATDKVVNRYSMVHDALRRELYERSPATPPVWQEGDLFPGALNADQQNLVQASGESYWFFENAFGRDSYDGLGATMKTVNNDPRIRCPNANWNGVTTNYCNGVTSDDVVAHEWGHAYTEYTHGLIYQWQPGALNESYSDIWGETVDLINGRQDADEGDITTKRPDGQCSTHSPASPIVVINSPVAIAKNCEAGAAQFGPQLTGTGIRGNVVLADDGTPNTADACTPLTNGAAVAGNIALVDRGACGFVVKVKNAQTAGAVAVLVADNVEATPSPLGGVDPTITIPSVRIRLSDGNSIKGALASSPVNVTMKDAAGDRVDSYRWLMGEDSTAFGGAIRDMWTPTCYGHPGKVSDAEYFCGTDDAGGVHSNSGVPNHGYALLVDGGTYNGVTVSGIGLDKSAAIYFRAMTQYQTPTSDFTDHADALAASCSDLVGQPINQLTTADVATPTPATPIAVADCTQVTAMAQAVELRTDPVQCNFQPLLAKDAPPVCGPGFKQDVVWKENFKDGLEDWEASQEVVFAGASGSPWVADTSPPGGRTGTVAYGPAPDQGRCDGSADDFSSRDSITSEEIELSGSRDKSPRLSFDHYVATEDGFDGGNVKVSINGGAFVVIPAAAYTFNKPTAILPEAAGNTNPMSGEEGFTGTDGGSVRGSWGQSQVDLTLVGVKRGDEIQLRFDIGRDGCGGNDGWYVDDITVSTCKAKKGKRDDDD